MTEIFLSIHRYFPNRQRPLLLAFMSNRLFFVSMHYIRNPPPIKPKKNADQSEYPPYQSRGRVHYYVQTAFKQTGTSCTYPGRVTAAQVDDWYLMNTLLTALLPLTTTSSGGAPLTWLSAVRRPTHGSPEQSRACDSRLACRHSTHSQTVNPMIQAGTRVLPAPVELPALYARLR